MIGGTKVTPRGIRELRKLASLRTLWLPKVIVDQEMAAALAELTQVERVAIGGTNYMRITQAEGEALYDKIQKGVLFLHDE